MSLILDASIALMWCFEDEGNPRSESILQRLYDGDEAWVPTLWLLDVANVIVSAERSSRILRSDTSRILHFLDGLPIHVEANRPISEVATVISLAGDYKLTAYDASYLHLALSTGYPLASAEDRLRAAASNAGVEVIG